MVLDRPGRPVAVDLFTGAGGLSLGLEQAGFDVAAAVELDPIHALTHRANFPYGEILCRNIREVCGADLVAAAGTPDIDVVVGGPPCQGFSLMGQRVLTDPRNELVFHFLRLVTEVRPKLFVMENVPGMATGAHTQLLDELIAGFQRAGYKVRLPYRILNAAHFGVPQDRKRLFLIGSRDDMPLPEYPEATTCLVRTDVQESLFAELAPCPTVAEAFDGLPEVEDYPSLFDTDVLRFEVRPTSYYGRLMADPWSDETDYSHHRQYDAGVLTGCLRARHTAISRERFAATPQGATEPISRFYRLQLDGVSNTLRAGTASDRGAFSAPRPIHPTQPRCITVREAGRLHSFPDWFRFHRTIWHGFRQIGNAVAPRVGRAVGAAMLAELGVVPQKSDDTLALGPEDWASFDMRRAATYFDVSPGAIPPRRRMPEKVG